MDKMQRLILINQYTLLSIVDKTRDYGKLITALSDGYPLEIEAEIDRSVQPEMPRADCEEVRNILDMYRSIQTSIRSLGQPDSGRAAKLNWASFKGFDGNNEGEQFAYARYLLEDCGLWSELYKPTMELNSHSATLDKYRAMLRKFRECKNLPMDYSDISALVSAAL